MQDQPSRLEFSGQHPATELTSDERLLLETTSPPGGLAGIKSRLHRWIKSMLDQIHPSGITMMDL